MSDQIPPPGPQNPEDQPAYDQAGQDQPEYLSSGSGDPLGRAPLATAAGGKKKAIIAGAVLGGLAIAGGAAYGIASFVSAGAQPAEALPAGTIGYVSVNLDPSGAQKIEAIKTLRKFPALRDEINIDTDDDLRKRLFEEIQKSGACESVDYAKDIEPWLGDRMAVAAVDTGADEPSGVGVIEVTDGSRAEEGLTRLQACAGEAASGEGEDLGGFVVSGDWVVIAETEEIAQQVTDAAADKPLVDDDSYNRWIDEAGESGIVSMYAAPAAGEYLASQLGTVGDQLGALGGATPDLSSGGGSDGGVTREQLTEMGFSDQEIDDLGLLDDAATESDVESPSVPAEVTEAFRDFEGAAATIRFNDGALEVEFAGNAGEQTDALGGSDRGGDVVETLPEDTLLAVGVGFADGWFARVMEQISAMSGEEMDLDSMIADLEDQTGLTLPEDIETLAGESLALAVGSDIDPEAIFNGGGPADIPVGIKIKGDAEKIDEVLAKLGPDLVPGSLLEAEAKGDLVALGANAEYRAKLVEDGGLGGTDAYQSVIEESGKAGALVFFNFDANGDWLTSLSGNDPTVAANIEPLSAFGISGWVEDGTAHGLLKLTTD